jgi:FixJ family two-component response regulator
MAGRAEAAGVRARTPVIRGAVERATDREVGVVAAVLATGSEKGAAHRLGLPHSTVKHHPRECAIQGRCGDDGAACQDPRSPAT